jgi:hypothetical protein
MLRDGVEHDLRTAPRHAAKHISAHASGATSAGVPRTARE